MFIDFFLNPDRLNNEECASVGNCIFFTEITICKIQQSHKKGNAFINFWVGMMFLVATRLLS